MLFTVVWHGKLSDCNYKRTFLQLTGDSTSVSVSCSTWQQEKGLILLEAKNTKALDFCNSGDRKSQMQCIWRCGSNWQTAIKLRATQGCCTFSSNLVSKVPSYMQSDGFPNCQQWTVSLEAESQTVLLPACTSAAMKIGLLEVTVWSVSLSTDIREYCCGPPTFNSLDFFFHLLLLLLLKCFVFGLVGVLLSLDIASHFL